MFNPKRLITLSIAASMVIPSFSTMTVLANEPFVELNDQEENTSLETANNSAVITLTQQDFTAPNLRIFRTETVTKEDGTGTETRYFLKSGDYTLTENITVTFPIYTDASANITIKLGQYTLTSTAFESFHLVDQANLTVTGAKDNNNKGTIQFTGYAFEVDSGTLKVNNINVAKRTDSSPDLSAVVGTGFYISPEKDKNSTITVEVVNSSINAGDGLMILTNHNEGNLPTITLKNTNLICTDNGISQYNASNITIENCMITAKYCGIFAGVGGLLNVSNSTIQSEGNSTLDNIGVSLLPKNYRSVIPFKAKIENCYGSGGRLGLFIDYNHLVSTYPIDFSIEVSNSTFESSSDVGFGYRASATTYKENDPIFQKNPTFLENVTTPRAIEDGGWNPIATNIIPYTIRTSSTPKNVAIEKIDISFVLETVPGTNNVLTKEAQTKTEEKIKEMAKQALPKNDVFIYSVQSNGVIKSEKPIALSYIEYNIKLTSPKFTTTTNGSYTFQAIITAKLQTSSIIGLRLFLKDAQESTQSAQIEDEFETTVLNETETTPDSWVLNVKLEDVLKTPGNVNSGLSSTKIEKIFNEIKDSAPRADQTLKGFELNKEQLTKLEKIDLNQAFEIKDIGEVIEIDGTETEKVVRPTSTSSSKPKPKPEAPAEEQPTTPVVGTPTSMYRLYNRLTGEHLYTTNKEERDSLLTSDTWKDEGQGWTAPSVSDFPVYRLLNPNTGDHHYTTDKNEFDTLPSYGWIAEGIAFFSADKDQEENVILHRVYNPNAQGAGSHHYTTDKNERDSLIAQGWIDEGTAWAGLPTE